MTTESSDATDDLSGEGNEGTPLPPISVPDHTLLRRIGRGAYGEVWLARNVMGAYRAVKIVFRHSFKDQKPFERELSGIRKYEPVSRTHDGFIDILHIGQNEEQGCFYYVMEAADDIRSGQNIDPQTYEPRTLSRELRPCGILPVENCLRLGLALTEALAALHAKGLVHRDIKPSNIIFVNGVAKLVDIGLVAEIEEANSLVGTHGFIPPEGPGAPTADIYALGKVLYEASTGKDRQEYPELPTNWDGAPDYRLFLELNEIVLQACKTEPAKRYQSAMDMHADLLLLATGKSVKRLKELERRLTKIKRAGVVCTAVVLVLAGVCYSFYREWRTRFEARQREIGESVAYGIRSFDSADPSAAVSYFAQALKLDQKKENEPLHRLRFGTTLSYCATLEYMHMMPTNVGSVQFSPDGKDLLVVCYNAHGQILSLSNERPPVDLNQQSLYRGAYSPDGVFIVTGSGGRGFASVLKATDGSQVTAIPHSNHVLGASFSHDGLRVVTASRDNTARVWDVKTGTQLALMTGHTNAVLYARFSPDDRLVLTCSRDYTARLWDARTGHQVGAPFQIGSMWVLYAAFSPDGRQIVTACQDHRARVFDVETRAEILPAITHDAGINSVEFSPDGRYILTASFDYTARLWLADGHIQVSPNGILRHSGRVLSAAFDPQGERIVTGCDDGSVRVWNLVSDRVIPVRGGRTYSPDGGRFLTTTSDAVQVHEVDSGAPMGKPIPLAGPLEALEFNNNGTYVLTRTAAEKASLVTVHDALTGLQTGPGILSSNRFVSAKLSNNRTRLVGVTSNTASLWDVITGKQICSLGDAKNKPQQAMFSGNDKEFLTWGLHTVYVGDSATGQQLLGPLRHPEEVNYAAFSPDGQMLVTCAADAFFTHCPARLWDRKTGKLLFELLHQDGVLSAAFTPDGRRVVTASEDFTAIIWDTRTGKQLAPPLRHGEKVMNVRVSQDGKWALTSSMDCTARLWDLESGAPAAPAFCHSAAVFDSQFVAGGRQVLTRDNHGNQYLWNLTFEGRPPGEMEKAALVLSGGTVVGAGSPSANNLPLGQLSGELPALFPHRPSQAERTIWHEMAVLESESQENWNAELFNLKQLQALGSDDPTIPQKIIQVSHKLAEVRAH